MSEARRRFLKTGLLAAGGLALGATAWSRSRWTGAERVRVGVIGTGDRGTGLIQLMNGLEGFEVVACADVIPFRLENAMKWAPKAKVYPDHEALLADPRVEAVLVCTPFATHAQIAVAALTAQKHVYCEKTLAKGLPDIQRIIDTAKQSTQVFQTGHQYHSSPLYNKARQMILDGYLGEITAVHCQWNRNGDWRRPVPDPKWERLINWRMYREYSGGLVAELMSHQIDFINWVTNSRPERVTGFGGIDHWKDGRETYDNIHLLYEYPSGLDAAFTCTTTNAHEDYQVKVLGSKATMLLGYSTGTIIAEPSKVAELGTVDGVSGATLQAWQKGTAVAIDAPGNDPTMDALRQFHASITDGAPVISDIRTGALTAKCVQMSLDAVDRKEVVHWGDYEELRF